MTGLLYIAVFAATVGCALGLALSRRADHAAFWLMGAMLGIAVDFLLMSQELLAFIQIIVYVGAVMVLFLFVIMLLNLRKPEPPLREMMTPFRIASHALVILGLAMALWGFAGDSAKAVPASQELRDAAPAAFSNEGVKRVVVELMTTWIYPFELVSLLLLAAVVGAVVVARRRPILLIDSTDAPRSSEAPKDAPPQFSANEGPSSSSSADIAAAGGSSPSGRLMKKASAAPSQH
jgi:NADH-quinone oxidoreductase subunit J